MAGVVKQTPGAIGYVELIYALENKMNYADVQNAAGKFVSPSLTASRRRRRIPRKCRTISASPSPTLRAGALPDLDIYVAAGPESDSGRDEEEGHHGFS